MASQVLKEYTGPGKRGEQDILFLLRPQTNNCFFESTLLSVFRSAPEYRKSLWLEYVANMSGAVVTREFLMQKHYEYRLYYALNGVDALSDSMKEKFEKTFRVDIDKCMIINPFEALEQLNMSALDLFQLSVEKEDRTRVEGQLFIRVYDDKHQPIYIINNDIPALMTMHNENTNAAVMLFRTTLNYKEFNRLILEVLDSVYQELMKENSDVSKMCNQYLSDEDIKILKGKGFFRHKRLFHFSHGPFEQILDARDFMFRADGGKIPMEDYTFTNYLMQEGISLSLIENLIHNPIVQIQTDRTIYEESLYIYTRGMEYAKARDIINRIVSQRLTRLPNFVVMPSKSTVAQQHA